MIIHVNIPLKLHSQEYLVVQYLQMMELYIMPSGSEPWAGFANEDVCLSLTFGEGGSIIFTGSTDGASMLSWNRAFLLHQ